MYFYGEGVSQNYPKAFKWFEKSAMQNNRGAQYNLAIMHEKGQGTLKDIEEAARWYSTAANNGHVKAMTKLGYMYYYGNGTEQNRKNAHTWWQKASELGDDDAKKNVGILLQEDIDAYLKSRRDSMTIQCSTKCANGSCVRIYPNGDKINFQAARKYNSVLNQWEWDAGQC